MLESKSAESGCDALSIVAVIVLYKVQARDATAFLTLTGANSGFSKPRNALHVSCMTTLRTVEIPGLCRKSVQYESAGNNSGIAAAYNRAWIWLRTSRLSLASAAGSGHGSAGGISSNRLWTS